MNSVDYYNSSSKYNTEKNDNFQAKIKNKNTDTGTSSNCQLNYCSTVNNDFINVNNTNKNNILHNRNRIIANFQSAKAEFNKSNSKKPVNSNPNYNSNTERTSIKLPSANENKTLNKKPAAAAVAKNSENEKAFEKPNKKAKIDFNEVICETHEINLEQENKLNKQKNSRSFSYIANKSKNSERGDNTTKERSTSTDNKNKNENNFCFLTNNNTNNINKSESSFCFDFSTIKNLNKKLSHSQECKNRLSDFESVCAENLKRNRNNINNKKSVSSKVLHEKENEEKLKKFKADKNPFSPSSFASQENTSTPTNNTKEAKVYATRTKLFKTNSCTNVGFFSSNNKISNLNSSDKNENNSNYNNDNKNNFHSNNSNRISIDNSNKPIKIQKDFENRIPLDRYSSMTNFNFFTDSKIRDRKLTNPFTPKNNSNNALNSTGTRFFTINEKDEEQIKEALVFLI